MVHGEGMFSILDDFSHTPLTAESAVCVDKKERNMSCILNFLFTFCVLVGKVQKLIVVKLEFSTSVSF